MIVTGSAGQRRTRERELIERLTPALVQFFVKDHRTRPVGSGVVVPIEDRPFIFTAAHVLAEAKTEELWASIGAEGDRRPLPPQTVVRASGDSTKGDHQHDRIDAAVMLVPEQWCDFVPTPVPPLSPPSPVAPGTHGLEVDRYMVLGFPANRVKWDKGETTSELRPLVSVEMPDGEYARLGYSRMDHLLLRDRRRWIRDKVKVQASCLKGVSGAPIFRFNADEADSVPELQAISIASKRPEHKDVWSLLATKVHHHVAIAHQLLESEGVW